MKYKNKGHIAGPVRMVKQEGRPNRYQMRVDIAFRIDGKHVREYWYGFGNDLKECWLDMFERFNDEYGNVHISNGQLRGHEVEYID
jgi:hypothetical protein